MKVALIRLPGTYADWNKYPALGLSYIASCLRLNGFNHRIFDAYFNTYSENDLIKKVMNYQPDIVGITAMTHEIVQAEKIASKLKQLLKAKIIIGGCHISALPKRTLTEFPVFDYGVIGEGEKTIIELLKNLTNNSKLDNIDGLVYHKKNKVIVNKPRTHLTSEELDKLPYPDFRPYFSKSNLSKYVMISSRGCPYNCKFCMRVLGKKVRRRSLENIYNEIKTAIKRYNTKEIIFRDEIFLFNDAHTKELLKMFIKKGLSEKIKWTAQIRADQVTKELMNLAKNAGCYMLGMGIESGDDKILSRLNKGLSIKQIEKSVKIIQKAGIKLETYFILGGPGENIQSIKNF